LKVIPVLSIEAKPPTDEEPWADTSSEREKDVIGQASTLQLKNGSKFSAGIEKIVS